MKKNTQHHQFTVVIPTRERCDTLEHALHTCVIQDYDNLEILVSDNFSQDRTREVVESYKDPRIRYINTGKRLSMTDNFEFALSHVRPEGYVIYIGDDDGLLPNAIREIDAVIVETGASVLQWISPSYTWPDLEGSDANQLIVHSLGSSGTKRRNSATVIQDVISFKASCGTLPFLYLLSAVEYDIIRRIKNASGRFYHSMTPDVYSGFAIAGAVGSFVSSRRPYTITGTSRHSNGASNFGSGSPEAGQKFLSEANLPFHSSLSMCMSGFEIIAECFLQARDHLPFFQEFTLDMQQLIFKMMEEAAPKPQGTYVEIKDAVLRIGEMHDIPKAAQRAIAANPHRGPGSWRNPTMGNLVKACFAATRLLMGDIYRGRLYVDCSSLSVNNIYDASLLCDHILRLGDMKVCGSSTVLKYALAHGKGRFFCLNNRDHLGERMADRRRE